MIALAHGLPVGAVVVGGVEVVAVDAPDLVKDLLPLGRRFDAHLDGVDVELALTGLGLLSGVDDAQPQPP